METPEIIALTEQSIANEHICCAFSDKKCKEGYQLKKDWLSDQFKHGYTFRKLDVRGKVFIEYVPAEKGWLPIHAPNWMLINCFWVSGQFKKKGNAKALLQNCIEDAKGMNGIVAVVGKKKQPFMSDKKFYLMQGFEVCDSADPYFELMYKPLKKNAPKPKFKEIARSGTVKEKSGIAVYYTSACPFNDFYVNTELKEVCKKKGIPFKAVHLDTIEKAQNHSVPHTLYSIFYKGKFVTQHVLNEKYFDKFISME